MNELDWTEGLAIGQACARHARTCTPCACMRVCIQLTRARLDGGARDRADARTDGGRVRVPTRDAHHRRPLPPGALARVLSPAEHGRRATRSAQLPVHSVHSAPLRCLHCVCGRHGELRAQLDARRLPARAPVRALFGRGGGDDPRRRRVGQPRLAAQVPGRRLPLEHAPRARTHVCILTCVACALRACTQVPGGRLPLRHPPLLLVDAAARREGRAARGHRLPAAPRLALHAARRGPGAARR